MHSLEHPVDAAVDAAAIDVAVVGELCVDLILSGDVTPAFGQAEKLVDDAVLTIGSSSAIAACGLARLGLRVAFHSVVGDDLFGRFMVEALAARGIETSGIVVDPTLKTGITVHLSRGVDRAMLTYSGSIAALRIDHLNLPQIGQARHLHMGSYYLLDALRGDTPALFAEVRRRGATVSLDTNYDPTEQWDGGITHVLEQVDCFLPNETESLAITRLPSWQAALARLAEKTPTVVVKRGAQGAAARRGETEAEARSPRVAVVDTTGAGDTFDAGFIYATLAGWELARALRFGCICGALSTQGAGGTSAQPTLHEALALLDSEAASGIGG